MTTDTVPRMTVAEIALMRAVVKWRKANNIIHDRRADMFTFPDGAAVTLLYGHDILLPAVGVTHKYAAAPGYEAFHWHDFSTITEAVDLLVALGYLPARFSSAYRVGWDARAAWAWGPPRLSDDRGDPLVPAGEQ